MKMIFLRFLIFPFLFLTSTSVFGIPYKVIKVVESELQSSQSQGKLVKPRKLKWGERLVLRLIQKKIKRQQKKLQKKGGKLQSKHQKKKDERIQDEWGAFSFFFAMLGLFFIIIGFLSYTTLWVGIGYLMTPLAIIFGIVGLRRNKRNPGKYKGKKLALLGLLIGSFTVVILAILAISAALNSR